MIIFHIDSVQEEIEDFEKDFLIINLTRRYTMSLEVKSSLSSNTLKSSKKQTDGTKKLIDEWLGATFTQENGWVFLGVMFFDEKSEKFSDRSFCSVCRNHVIIGGIDEFESKFENIIETNCGVFEISATARKEFLEVVECILFFASFDPVITSSKRLSKKVVESLNIAGMAENIEVWRCLTPNQLYIMKGTVYIMTLRP